MAPIRKKPLRSPVKDPAKRRRTRSSSSSAEPKGPPPDRNSADLDQSQVQQEAIQSPPPEPTHEEIFGPDSDADNYSEGEQPEKEQPDEQPESGEAEWTEGEDEDVPDADNSTEEAA